MLLEDALEPLARDIADFLVKTEGAAGSSWGRYTRDEDLVPLKRHSDDVVEYVRATNHEARIILSNIRPVDPDPNTIVIHDPIVLSSEAKASASAEIDNRGGSREQSYTFRKEFRDGENESKAVEAGFSVENTAKIEAGGEASQFKVSQEFKTTVSSAWTNQTGKSKEQITGGEFPLIAPAHTYVKGFLQWNEQTLQRRIECYGSYDMKIELGRFQRYKKYNARKAKKEWRHRWASGSPVQWDSLEHLMAVAERRGSVHFNKYEHYARFSYLNPVFMERIRASRRQHIDQLTPAFKGAAGIKVVIEESLTPETK